MGECDVLPVWRAKVSAPVARFRFLVQVRALAPLAEWRRHGRALQILRIVLESSVSGDLHFRIRRRMFSGSLVCTSLQESKTQLLRTFLHELMTSQRTRPDRGLAITHGAIDRLFTQPVLCHTAIIKLQNLCAYI